MPEPAWIPEFVCPACGSTLVAAATVGASTAPRSCRSCDAEVACRGGIFRFLSDPQLAQVEPLIAQYRRVRAQDGYRERAAAYYRQLPQVSRGDPQDAVWRIRQESFRHLCRRVLTRLGRRSLRVLDLGAGNGWLSHRLTLLGNVCVAVDWLDDPDDGLGAALHYPTTFTRVQADFDRLPVVAGQFDAVIFNASLHYSANPSATLRSASKALMNGGALVVMDSPVFASDADGRRMLAERRQGFADRIGRPVEWGAGYLTVDGLERTATDAGMMLQRIPSRGGPGWAFKRWLAGRKLRRQPASFGIWSFGGRPT
jgi:SAM-dependent methyltransferase